MPRTPPGSTTLGMRADSFVRLLSHGASVLDDRRPDHQTPPTGQSSPPTPLSRPDAAGLAERYLAGESLAQIALTSGLSRETVRRRLIDVGVNRRPRGAPPSPVPTRIKDRAGYVLVRLSEHPRANASGYVREHRLVLERVLGRLLRPEEVVHHINRVKNDNRPENLQLFESNSAHKRADMIGNQWAKGDLGNPKRRYRVRRTPEQLLHAIRLLAAQLGREVRRRDLAPPAPSYRAIARAFGSWQAGAALALAERGPLSELQRDPHDPEQEQGLHRAA